MTSHPSWDRIAPAYARLFPARPPQVGFLAGLAGGPPARILDLACGTGEQAAALAARGYDVTGVDLDPSMRAEALRRHGSGPNPAFLAGDLRAVGALPGVAGPFALVYSVGNSLALLADDAELSQVLAAMRALASPGGAVAAQFVNFDRVGREGTAEGRWTMPTLRSADGDEPAELERSYDLAEWPAAVRFRTRLRVGGETHERETRALALTRARLEAASPAGARLEWFGDWDRRPWSDETPATILVIR